MQDLHPNGWPKHHQAHSADQPQPAANHRTARGQLLPVHGKQQHREVTAGRNGERQNYGENYRGEGAINFGDYTLEPPSINPQQARQFEKEFDLRMKEAQDLSKNLRDRQDLAKQVQDMLDRMKQMKSKMLHDEQELERLQSSVIEGFRQLELDLSKQLQQVISRENLHLAKDEDVPEAYRRQVEEYYKALSKRN